MQPLLRNAQVISDSLLWVEGAVCSLASRAAKAQVALRTLSLKGKKHMLCPPSHQALQQAPLHTAVALF